MKREWLLLEGKIVRARPGYVFDITEVVKPQERMSDADFRKVGRPTRDGKQT